MSHYDTLNIKRDASVEEIKKSYRKLAKEHHPDVNGGDDQKFKQIHEAYETLSDPKSREMYDLRNRNNSGQEEFERAWRSAFNNSDSFSDMFNSTFGGSSRGPDVRVSLNITFEEVYEGTRRYINIGSGGFYINIPKGIKNGAKLKVRGKGHPHHINTSAPKGDVVITVNLLYDDDVIINGDDIYVDLFLEWHELLLGGEFEVKTKFKTVKIKVPQGSYDSKLLRVVGKGMPIYNTEGYGNLMVKLRTNTINLTEEQIDFLKNIKE
mgnify:CR=1 FL=1